MKVFVGSSKEAFNVARELSIQLEKNNRVRTRIWDRDVFNLSRATLEELTTIQNTFDFAVFVLSPDDRTESRRLNYLSPRDNVLFECGLFMGALGRSRTFVLCDTSKKLKIPSDFAGVTFATYDGARFKKDPAGSLRTACTEIERAIIGGGLRANQLKRPSIEAMLVTLDEKLKKLDTNLLQLKEFQNREKEVLDSVYSDRSSHYKEEKKVIAEDFLDQVLKPRVGHLKKALNDRSIRIVFDAGTTLDPILDSLGCQAHNKSKHWCKDIPVYTNNVKGIQNMLRYREKPSRYSDLPIRNFFALPGRILAPFEAIADDDTLKCIISAKIKRSFTRLLLRQVIIS
jgi:hypothetical protein